MNLIKTKFVGLFLLKPTLFKDHRGCFIETYNQKNINKLLGNLSFIQENESESFRGVLRGLHFQKPPYAQSKLVRCLKGSVLDVALDLRKHSKTYGQCITTVLSSEKKDQLFIPKGFAHGFIVLSESAIFSYKVDEYYNPESECGISYKDKFIDIDWGFDDRNFIISSKDKKLNSFDW